MTRNGVEAEGSMLGFFSDMLPGRLRREPGLSWGDSLAGRVRLRERLLCRCSRGRRSSR